MIKKCCKTLLLGKQEIYEEVLLKLRDYDNHFAFLNKEYLKILINVLVDAIYESQEVK
jgi:hypothetical protein